MGCRNQLFLLFQTPLLSLNALLKRRIHGLRYYIHTILRSSCRLVDGNFILYGSFSSCRAVLFLLAAVHLTLLNTTEMSLYLDRSLYIHLTLSWWCARSLTLLLLSFVIQANNAYIFPGFGLGLIMSGTIRVRDDMLLAACKCKSDLMSSWIWIW